MRYKHTSKMGQILGLGESYEARCQRMLHAGVSWVLRESDKRDLWLPSMEGFRRVFYVTNESSAAISTLEQEFKKVEPNPSLVQMYAVLSRVLYVHHYRCDRYVDA